MQANSSQMHRSKVTDFATAIQAGKQVSEAIETY
jgi:hypothetical protein